MHIISDSAIPLCDIIPRGAHAVMPRERDVERSVHYWTVYNRIKVQQTGVHWEENV